MMNDLVPTVWVSYYHNHKYYHYYVHNIHVVTCMLKVQMFAMLLAMYVGRLPEHMIRLSCCLTSPMLLGVICVVMVTRIVVLL